MTQWMPKLYTKRKGSELINFQEQKPNHACMTIPRAYK